MFIENRLPKPVIGFFLVQIEIFIKMLTLASLSTLTIDDILQSGLFCTMSGLRSEKLPTI